MLNWSYTSNYIIVYRLLAYAVLIFGKQISSVYKNSDKSKKNTMNVDLWLIIGVLNFFYLELVKVPVEKKAQAWIS